MKQKKNTLNAYKHNFRRYRVLYLMILPSIITVFIFHYIPIYGLQIAFKNFKPNLGIWGSPWVGFDNFIKFFKYPYFTKILKNTVWISFRALLNFPFPIIFAIMLHEMQNQRVKKICQQLTYAPHFVSVVVVCSMVSIFTNRETGLINLIIQALGGEAKDFMGDPAAFADIYALSELWTRLGWGTIIYLAALSGVSEELVEAAKLDGAGRMQVIRYVYIPHLMPTIITLLILNMGTLLSVGFEKTFLLQNPLNMDASSVIATYVYEVGMSGLQYSYSTAIGLFNSIVSVIFVLVANMISRKVTEVALW